MYLNPIRPVEYRLRSKRGGECNLSSKGWSFVSRPLFDSEIFRQKKEKKRGNKKKKEKERESRFFLFLFFSFPSPISNQLREGRPD